LGQDTQNGRDEELESREIFVSPLFSMVWTEFTGKKVSIKVGFLFGLEEQIVH
jgi:hypothetical protein